MKLPKWYCITTGQCAELKGFGTMAVNVSSATSQTALRPSNDFVERHTAHKEINKLTHFSQIDAAAILLKLLDSLDHD
jgi:hypothetical protein